jgi:hypothetical protein
MVDEMVLTNFNDKVTAHMYQLCHAFSAEQDSMKCSNKGTANIQKIGGEVE